MPKEQGEGSLQRVVDQELELLEPRVRACARTLDRLLAEDFLEIGGSGIRFDKIHALDRLPREQAPTFEVSRIEPRSLTPDLIQVLYRAKMQRPEDPNPRYSLRSSLWRRCREGWEMVFHQGTPCAPWDQDETPSTRR